MTDPADLPALLAALEVRMLGDRSRGELRPATHYAEGFPEARAAVEVLHARLAHGSRDALGEITDRALAAAAARGDGGKDPGQRVAAARLDHELGRGGRAWCSCARDRRLDRTVALSCCRCTARSRSGRGTLPPRRPGQRRASTTRASARAFDAGCSDGYAFLAMRPIEGQSLQQHLASLPAAPTPARRRAAAVLEQMARALQHAHERGVVHRDVKPGDVLLAAAGTPVLVELRASPPMRASMATRLNAVDRPARRRHPTWRPNS